MENCGFLGWQRIFWIFLCDTWEQRKWMKIIIIPPLPFLFVKVSSHNRQWFSRLRHRRLWAKALNSPVRPAVAGAGTISAGFNRDPDRPLALCNAGVAAAPIGEKGSLTATPLPSRGTLALWPSLICSLTTNLIITALLGRTSVSSATVMQPNGELRQKPSTLTGGIDPVGILKELCTVCAWRSPFIELHWPETAWLLFVIDINIYTNIHIS